MFRCKRLDLEYVHPCPNRTDHMWHRPFHHLQKLEWIRPYLHQIVLQDEIALVNKVINKNSLTCVIISKHMASIIQDSTLNEAIGSTSFFPHFSFELSNSADLRYVYWHHIWCPTDLSETKWYSSCFLYFKISKRHIQEEMTPMLPPAWFMVLLHIQVSLLIYVISKWTSKI